MSCGRARALPGAVVLAVALAASAACGGGRPAPAAPPDPAADKADAQRVFTDYNQALLARDFDTACGLIAPETAATMVQQVSAKVKPVTSCQEAFADVYAKPEAGVVLDNASRNMRVTDVAVDRDTAYVTITADANGQPMTVTARMRRVDGQWRVLSSRG